MSTPLFRNNSEGFTLIELLVTISIIGVVASTATLAINPLQKLKQARDAVRLNDMITLTKALQFYFINTSNQQYATTGSYGESEAICGGWDSSAVDNDSDGNPFIEFLIDLGNLTKVPTDPINNGNCSAGFNYRYYRYSPGSSGCDASRGGFYVFGINDLETSSRPHPQSPGWRCPGRNWQGEFDWVTGKFENY